MQEYIPIETIKELAFKEGFCDVGAAKIEKVDVSFYRSWLSKGYNASMNYLSNKDNLLLREDPRLLLEKAQTIFCFLMPYNDEDVLANSPYKIASYAQRKDYHFVIKSKLRNIIAQIKETIPNFQAVAFVDSAPLLECFWAVRCGLGWKGKNSLLTTKDFGNKVFISEILACCSSDYSVEQKNHCGSCRVCIEACPNKAIKDNCQIDANLCTSYQTIENKNCINANIDTQHFIYGCDICLTSCIWNKKARKIATEDKDIKQLLCQIVKKVENNSLTKEDFNKLKKQTSISRIKYEKFLSNISYNQTHCNND